MREQDLARFQSMPRSQFIHFTKDFLHLALERAGGTDEFTTALQLFVEDAEPTHRARFLLQMETIYRTWGKDYYEKGRDHNWLISANNAQ